MKFIGAVLMIFLYIFLFFFRSLLIFMTVIMALQAPVIAFVIRSGKLPINMPCRQKNTDPRPIARKVGRAIPSVSRVLKVYMA